MAGVWLAKDAGMCMGMGMGLSVLSGLSSGRQA